MNFSDSRLKIERADRHIIDIDARLAALEDRIIVSVEINADGGNEVIKYELEDVSVYRDIALMLGDAVHNLKCALDYAWAQVIEKAIPTIDVRFVKFPVHPTANSLESALRGQKIDIACKGLYELLLSNIHPYKGGNFAIWDVHQLDKRDKHRLLTPVIHYSSASGIDTEDEMGILQKGGGTWGTSQPYPHYVPMPLGWHVKDKGKPSISIMFQYGDAGEESRPVDTLRVYSRMIFKVVERLEAFTETI